MAASRKSDRNLRHEQAAETREKLLAAAKNLFAHNGYHGTPVRAINRELGMADGILYHYFPGGKREMLNILIKESFVQRMQMLEEANVLIETQPLADALDSISKRLYDSFLDDADMMRIMFREHEVLDIEGIEVLTNLVLDRHRWFAGILERKHLAGEVRKLDFEFAAKQFMSMNMIYVIGRIIGVNFTGVEDAEAYRTRVIRYSLELWANP